MSSKIEIHAIVKGRVQGVGFRWTVLKHASDIGIKGTVKNLSDGSVEIIAQGTQTDLENLLENIQKDSGIAKITSISKTVRPVSQQHSQFQIVH